MHIWLISFRNEMCAFLNKFINIPMYAPRLGKIMHKHLTKKTIAKQTDSPSMINS
jgi:hypothetical protein